MITALINYLPEREAITASLQLCKVNDSFGKGFDALKAHILKAYVLKAHMLKAHMLKAHVLNYLMIMTGWCLHKSLQLRPKFHSLIPQNSFNFQKSATFKGLKSSPRLY